MVDRRGRLYLFVERFRATTPPIDTFTAKLEGALQRLETFLPPDAAQARAETDLALAELKQYLATHGRVAVVSPATRRALDQILEQFDTHDVERVAKYVLVAHACQLAEWGPRVVVCPWI